MRTPTRRRLSRVAVPSLVVPLLLTSLAACGGSDDDEPASTPSSTSSTSSPSATAVSGKQVSTKKFQALVTRSVDKATTAQIALTLVSSSGTVKGKGQVDYNDDSPALSMKLSAPQLGNADLRVVDKTLYVSLPAVDKSGTFYRSDLTDPGSAAEIGGLSGFDPASSLADLSKTITDVTFVGAEELDGDQVDHYTFHADGSALSGAAGAGSSAEAAQDVTVDAFFDDQDLLRKTETQLNAQTKVTVTLTDWGGDVDIEAPPADKVKDMPSSQQ